MCFGTFDLVHLGHIAYFQEAKKYGDYLIVVVARDVTKKEQGKETIFSEEERRELIQNLAIVDEAVLGYPDNHLKIILQKKPDVICLGYDHNIKEPELRRKLEVLGLRPQVVRITSYLPAKYKSGKIKRVILQKFF